jgi:multiple sugar transport system permease protein
LRRQPPQIASLIILALLALTTVIPLVWMVFTSLHPSTAQVPTLRTLFAPDGWHFENYWHVLSFPELPIWRYALNSVVVSGGVVLFQLAICSLAAFGFARLRFPGRDALFAAFMLTMMIPAPVLVVPLFALVQQLGWLDTYLGLIVPYQYFSAAFGTFLLRQHFAALPRSLDDAARLDGCGELRLYWHILLPSARPALATVAVFAFIWSWGDFYWPLLASSSMEMRTLEVGLSSFRDSYGGTRWPLQMTAAVITLAPVLVVFLAMQRFFVSRSLTSGLKL